MAIFFKIRRQSVQWKMGSRKGKIVEKGSIGIQISMLLEAFYRMVNDCRRSIVATSSGHFRQLFVIFPMKLTRDKKRP